MPPPVTIDHRSTFAATRSAEILQAAMHYPPAMMAKPEAPVSLTASDGTGLELISYDARAVIDGPLAFTELHLQFRNPQSRTLEGRFRITMPEGAAISRLAMKIDGGWMEAEMVERQLARRAYEDFLHRRQDPALLEKAAGNEFRARIFPIPANGIKEIVISYSQELPDSDGVYRLPLRGFPAIAKVAVDAQVASRAGSTVSRRHLTLSQSRWKPDRDFEVRVKSNLGALRSGDLVVARIKPRLSAVTETIGGMTILFDTSASRALGFSTQVKGLGQLLAHLAKQHPELRVSVATFDQVVSPIYEGKASGFGKKQLGAILARRPLGASDLGAALTWAAGRRTNERLLVVSDGIATAGQSGDEELRAAAKRLSATVQRIDVLLAGGIRNTELAAQLVRGTAAKSGVILDGADSAAELSRRLSQTTASNIAVSVPGAQWVWPKKLDGVQPGNEVLVYAQMAPNANASKLEVRLSGTLSQTHAVKAVSVAAPLLSRAAARAHISRLTAERGELGPDDKARRLALEKQIVALSTQHRVLSDFTALLVLETEADYARYGINRKSLAGIMRVGKSGVEVFSRTKPVMMAGDGVPNKVADTKNKGKDGKKLEAAKEDAKDSTIRLSQAGIQNPLDPSLSNNSRDTDREKSVATNAPGGPPAPPRADPAPRPRPTTARRQRVHRRPASRRPVRRPPPAESRPSPEPVSGAESDDDDDDDRGGAQVADKPKGPPPLTGKMADIAKLVAGGKSATAVVTALKWRTKEPGDVLALVALGESLEAHGNPALAARAYGSIIDLFPSRADMRRMAGERLERLKAHGAALAADTYAKAVEQRPDHLTGHRLLAYALVRAGKLERAFAAIERGLTQRYPSGRFAGGVRILQEDLGIIGAAWLAKEPARANEIQKRLSTAGAKLARSESLRFVLYWETDANDVDFHIHDGKGGHAYYSNKDLPSGGSLYADVTTGYGPECFNIEGTARAFPYTLRIHYYSRGPMGYGMGKLEIVHHDGKGNLRFEQRPYVVMNDGSYVELGQVTGPPAQAIAR